MQVVGSRVIMIWLPILFCALLPMSNSSPIGIFDSGIGGLSVWRAIARQLPREDTIYFADQLHIPYGPRSLQEIRSFSEAIARLLLDRGSKLIVVACNT